MKLYYPDNHDSTKSLDYFIGSWIEAYRSKNIDHASRLLATTPCAAHMAIGAIQQWAIQENDSVLAKCMFYAQACGVGGYSSESGARLIANTISQIWTRHQTAELNVEATESGSCWLASVAPNQDAVIIFGQRNVAIINSIYELACLLFQDDAEQISIPLNPGALIAVHEVACWSSKPPQERSASLSPDTSFASESYAEYSMTNTSNSITPNLWHNSSLSESPCTPQPITDFTAHWRQAYPIYAHDVAALFSSSQSSDSAVSPLQSDEDTSPHFVRGGNTPTALPEPLHQTGSSVTPPVPRHTQPSQTFSIYNSIDNQIPHEDLLKTHLYNGRIQVLEPSPDNITAGGPNPVAAYTSGPIVAGVFPRPTTETVNKKVQNFIISLLHIAGIDSRELGLEEYPDSESMTLHKVTESWKLQEPAVKNLLLDRVPLFANTFAENPSLMEGKVYKDHTDNNYFYLTSDKGLHLRPALGQSLFEDYQIRQILLAMDSFATASSASSNPGADSPQSSMREIPKVSPDSTSKKPHRRGATRPTNLFLNYGDPEEPCTPDSPTSCEIAKLLAASNTPRSAPLERLDSPTILFGSNFNH